MGININVPSPSASVLDRHHITITNHLSIPAPPPSVYYQVSVIIVVDEIDPSSSLLATVIHRSV